MAEPGDGDTQGTAPRSGQPSGSALLAEMLREQAAAAPPPPPPVADAYGRPPRKVRGGGDNSTGKVVLGALVVALLLGGGLGVFMADQGIGMTSKAKFVKKADAVCAPSNAPVAGLAKPSSYPDLATAAGTLVTTTETQLGGLRALKLPGGNDGGRARDVLATMTATNQAGRQLQDAASRKDDAATAAATQLFRTSATEASTRARELGMASCVTGMQPGVENVIGGATGVVKTAFLAKADTLCRAGARALEGIRPPSGPRDLSRFFNAFTPIVTKLVADLKALPVPPGDEAVIGEIMTGLDKGLDQNREMRDAALAGDVSRFNAIDGEATILTTAIDAKLDAYGLTTCGSNFGGR